MSDEETYTYWYYRNHDWSETTCVPAYCNGRDVEGHDRYAEVTISAASEEDATRRAFALHAHLRAFCRGEHS